MKSKVGNKQQKTAGFTLVELLIVIVVIAILAAISVVAYSGIQQRARDSQRVQDVKTIAQALELYYMDNGHYPASGCSPSCPTPKKINSSWATTSDGTWSILESALVPECVSALPADPRASVDTPAAIYGGYNYDYVITGSWCSADWGHLYMLTYRLENEAQTSSINGRCPDPQPTNYSSSEYVGVK